MERPETYIVKIGVPNSPFMSEHVEVVRKTAYDNAVTFLELSRKEVAVLESKLREMSIELLQLKIARSKTKES